MQITHGVFTISLDFELYWGVHDTRRLDQYRANLDGVQRAIPAMLDAFARHEIHATWATVGFLFCRDLDELSHHVPERLPCYEDARLSPYAYMARANSMAPAYHFAPTLIEQIRQTPHQEIGSHTFSHYLCLEPGQSAEAFEADLLAAISLARQRGIDLRSLVLPRNQWNPAYGEVLVRHGIRCYRGNEQDWLHRAHEQAGESRLRRGLRLLDSYVNLTGQHTHALDASRNQSLFNFPASRFLRPWSPRLAVLDDLRLARITRAMDDAARRKRLFHLWWHPHNFGSHIAQNLAFLERIFAHYQRLQASHGMQSLNMGELCELAVTSQSAGNRRLSTSGLPGRVVPGQIG